MVYFYRRLSSADTEELVRRVFLEHGLLPTAHIEGRLILWPTGEPLLRLIDFADGSLAFFNKTFFKEPVDGQS